MTLGRNEHQFFALETLSKGRVCLRGVCISSLAGSIALCGGLVQPLAQQMVELLGRSVGSGGPI